MKVAFVVTRFGQEINGGAEYHCRQFVERMKDIWDIDVLTTCALDYYEWENYFPAGRSVESGYSINRFRVDHCRPVRSFSGLYNTLINLYLLKYQGLDLDLSTDEHIRRLHEAPPERCKDTATSFSGLSSELLDEMEQMWMKLQGPVSSSLTEYLRLQQHKYDLVFFFSYNYATTYYGLPEVAHKSILIPTAHKEACLVFRLFRPMFKHVAYFLYNSRAEKKMLEHVFPDSLRDKPGEICGSGIDLPEAPSDAATTLNRYGLEGVRYLIYIGRLDSSKGLDFLFRNFLSYRHQQKGPLKLVAIGKCYMELPEHPDILFPGFISDEEKLALLSGASLFVMPSPFESLSLSLLEAWSMGIPALVNGNCEVLKDHCLMSSAGFYYNDEESFHFCLHQLLSHPELMKGLGMQGKKYVRKNYSWKEVRAKIRDAAAYVCQHSGKRQDLKPQETEEQSPENDSL
ncbi:MAG: glycosyltransferase family 4 protein [Deltaproteobacteria bacterium]|nr:glycosyltransferase family 4 protein [Deltaproteobacteria bacterium]